MAPLSREDFHVSRASFFPSLAHTPDDVERTVGAVVAVT